MITVLLLLIGHMFGDFYLQPFKLSEKKKSSFKYLIIHTLLYGACFIIPLMLLTDIINMITTVLIISGSHFIIDLIKIYIDKKYKSVAVQYFSFIIDQVIHMAIIIVITANLSYYNSLYNDINSILISVNDNLTIDYVIKMIFVLLLIINPASIFVKHTFNYIFRDATNVCEENDNTGNIIGKLERLVIVLLGVLGLYTTIGIVLTAKSIARFNKLSEKDFAERYLIGTLLSLVISIIGLIILKVNIK